MLRIEPVRPEDVSRALRVLVGDTGGAQRRLNAFEALLAGPGGPGCRLWWARTLRGPKAAAVTVPNAGGCDMLYYSTPRHRSAVRTHARLLADLSQAALDAGTPFVQAMVPPDAEAPAEAFRQARFIRAAELIYMRRELRQPPGEQSPLTWPAFRQGQEARLAEIIADTYRDSLDCPDMLGLRDLDDVIAGHKASGLFRPASWWMPALEGETVGCVLVNDDIERAENCELVYLGTRPAYRRRGFARAMLRHALADATRRGLSAIHLAVDSANAPALNLYGQERFFELDRKVVFIRPPERSDE